MYLITYEQFCDVVAEENGRSVRDSRLVPSFGELVRGKEFVLPGNPLYGKLLHLGSTDGWPLLTFTSARDLVVSAPNRGYIECIAAGLRETYGMSHVEISEYLAKAAGIAGTVSSRELREWVQERE
jgi:hypothetical protein